MEISIPTFPYFFSFFHLICTLLNSFFSPILLVSKIYGLAFELYNIFWGCSELLAITYILDLLKLLFMESVIRSVCSYAEFFLVFKFCNSHLQIKSLILEHIRFMYNVDAEHF